jgi:hypothetical protein
MPVTRLDLTGHFGLTAPRVKSEGVDASGQRWDQFTA